MRCSTLRRADKLSALYFLFCKKQRRGEKKNVRIGATSQQCVMGAGIAALGVRYGILVHISPEIYSGEKIWRSLQTGFRTHEI